MDVQSIFYILAIVCMTMGIVVLVGIIAILVAIDRKVTDTQKFVENKLNEVLDPIESVAGIANAIIKKFRG